MRYKVTGGLATVAAMLALFIAAGGDLEGTGQVTPTPTVTVTPTVTPTATPGACDRTATTSTLNAQIGVATNGQTICLASGNYGAWQGTNKAVTLRPQEGATPVLAFELGNGDGNFTLDGLDIPYGAVDGNAGGFTVRNSDFEGITRIDTTGDPVTFEGNEHVGTNVQNGAPAGRVTVFNAHPDSVIRDSLFRGGCADGIQFAVYVTIENNEFDNIEEGACPNDPHTDSIQALGRASALIRGNWIHDSAAGIVAFDGAGGIVAECNVIGNITRPGGLTYYSDTGSVMRWNTLYGGNNLELDRKGGDPAGSGTTITENVAASISAANGSTWGTRSRNLLAAGATGSDVSGTPTFTGGATPTTWAGFALSPLSAGYSLATGGGQVGAHNSNCNGLGPREWA